jgi:hypothetical protein
MQRDSNVVMQRASQPTISQINSNCTNSVTESKSSSEDTSMMMQMFDEVMDEPEQPKIASTSTNNTAPSGNDMNEKLAISAIRKQLMSFDYSNPNMPVNKSNCGPMNQHIMISGQHLTNQQIRQMYRPPPAYSAPGPIRQMAPSMSNSSGMGTQMGLLSAAPYPTKVIKHRPQPSNGPPAGVVNSQIIPGSPGHQMPPGGVFVPNGMIGQNQVIIPTQQMMVNSPMSGPAPRMTKTLMERKQKALYQQMQQKQRLMAQQQQQQMKMQTPQHELPPFEPMNEVLLNNTIPPNVTLQAISRQPNNAQQQLSPQIMNGSNSMGSYDPMTGAPMSPRFNMMSNMHPHSPSPQPSMNAQMMVAQHSPGTQRSHSSASNPQGRGFSPSPSLASPSPHLNSAIAGPMMQTSSPHPYSPASPASGMLPQSNSSANSMQPSVASTAVGSPGGNWSPLPPPILRANTNSVNQQNMGMSAAQLANRMQQQNPMLNAQLSQGPVGFITNVTTVANNTAPLNSSGTAPNTPQPPNSPSPSLLSNMRFNRNSPVPTGNSSNQYPLSPGFHGIHSPSTPPMQAQQPQMSSMNAQRAPSRTAGNSRLPAQNVMPSVSVNNSGYFQTASTVNTGSGSFSNSPGAYGSSDYVKQELRARVGVRTLPVNSMQMQQSSGSGMSPGMSMQNSNVPQMRLGSASAVSPIGAFHNSSGGMMTMSMGGNQMGSTLTPEDFDAVDIGFDLSEQMNATPDSPLFNLGDLTDSSSMVSSSLNRSNSIGRSVRFD